MNNHQENDKIAASPLNWNKGRISNTKWTRSKSAKEKKSILLNGMFVCQNGKRYNQIYRIKITISDTKGVFDLAVSITQFSDSITHNSKMVGPMTKRLFGKR